VLGAKACSNPFFVPPDRDPQVPLATCKLDLFLAVVQAAAGATADRERLRQELEQAYAALARKIYENWQEEETLRASEKELQEKDGALVEYRRRLQTILQHLPALLMSFDRNNRLAACNHEFERVTGFRAEEVMGKLMPELIEVEGEGLEELSLAHPPEGGNYRGREWNLRCKDGSLRSVSWSNISRYVPIPGWSNWIMGLDVTPRVHAELGLRSLSVELNARTAELEAFGYAVSHDLSGQLAKISGNCAVIQELYGVALSPPCREMLREIHEATLGMVGRIAALQRFTTLAAGELRPEQVDLSAMAAEIAARLRWSGRDRRVTFSIEDGVTATGDKKLLRLAMEQLLENAWNSTCGVQHPVIRFGTTQVEGERSFFVSDNGPRFTGPPEAQLEPRRWGNASEVGGGIGLATVQRIISLHRGRIWAADEAGKGATFYFRV
jgi:PAS domain S-box-containing protein